MTPVTEEHLSSGAGWVVRLSHALDEFSSLPPATMSLAALFAPSLCSPNTFTLSYPMTPMLFLTAHLSGPRAILIYWHSSHELILWPPVCCHTACLMMSDYCLTLLSVSICLSLSLCLILPFTLWRGRQMWKHKDKRSQPILKGWNDGHYCSRRTNYNLCSPFKFKMETGFQSISKVPSL